MPGTTAPDFRVLALSGGACLGLYTATVLAGLEDHTREPLARRFDLVAGPSVGGILAAAVARLLDTSRPVLGPKYTGTALRDALQAHLGERTLADVPHALLLPTVNVTRSLTKVFKTPHAPASRGDESVRVLDAVMATCAAPAQFPAMGYGPKAENSGVTTLPFLSEPSTARYSAGAHVARCGVNGILSTDFRTVAGRIVAPCSSGPVAAIRTPFGAAFEARGHIEAAQRPSVRGALSCMARGEAHAVTDAGDDR